MAKSWENRSRTSPLPGNIHWCPLDFDHAPVVNLGPKGEGEQMRIKLYKTPGSIAVAKSRALFRVTGRGVHNREFNHRVIKFKKEGLILSAQPSVISNQYLPNKDYDAGTIAIGDTLTVDGVEYIVTARSLADPILVRKES